jgi:tRNA(Ile)-lysidine synthase
MSPQPKPRPVANPDQMAALTRELARLTGTDPAKLRFGVAVSGGPDSAAMLLLMREIPLRGLEAATVDHGLRPESASEAEMVGRLCQSYDIPHQTLGQGVAITGSVQARARAMRYAALEAWRVSRKLDYVLTAHHADDQAETLIMRLNRASGVAGLSAIRDRNGTVLRPLLGWRRAELAAVVAAAEVPVADDPSNRDPRFDRARLRMQLDGAPWLDAAAFARSAALLGQADTALEWAAAQVIAGWPDANEPSIVRWDDWPDEIAWRIMRLRLSAFANQEFSDQGQLLQAIMALHAGRKVSLGTVTVTPDRSDPTLWRIANAPPRRQ